MSEDVSSRLLAMLCPPDAHPDDNPVFMICRSDNCSFTWTGEMHIHQVGRKEEVEREGEREREREGGRAQVVNVHRLLW